MIRRRTVVVGGAVTLAGAAALLARGVRPLHASRGAPDAPPPLGVPPEGGEVLLDPAAAPATLREPPMLLEKVRNGELPPVAQRIGLDPIVVRPLHEVGRYGGTMRRAFVGPEDGQDISRLASGPDNLLYWDYSGRTVRPNIARAFEFGDGDRILTLSLRRGMRWSDGTPFTADDIMFWYERMYLDDRIVGAKSSALSQDGKDVVIRKVDKETVEFVSPGPYPLLTELLASYTEIGGLATHGRSGMGGFAPGHYLQHLHPDYRSEAELQREAREHGFATWAARLKASNYWTLNPDLPVICPWRMVTPTNSKNATLERNPYSVWVDTDGNQLPYIDRIDHVLCLNPEGVTFKAVAGELDYQQRSLYISKLPFLLQNRRKSGYEVSLQPFIGADLAVRFNLDYTIDPVIGRLLADKTFRRALSLGIDRRQINETFEFGLGTPSSGTPGPQSIYDPGPEWAARWAQHDPARANRMLDGLGLTQRDSEGFRLRPDGRGRLTLICTAEKQTFDFPALGEMIRDQWRAIGINSDIKQVDGTLVFEQAMSGEIQLYMYYVENGDPLLYPDPVFPSQPRNTEALIGIDYARWFLSNGSKGKEPPPELKDMMRLWHQGRAAPPDQRIEIGRELIRRQVDLVLSIGLVTGGFANMGITVANRDLGNVPKSMLSGGRVKSPSNALPITFYFRNEDRRA